MSHPEETEHSPHDEDVKFRGWRLLGFIMSIVVVIAVISAIVDYVVIGPLDGRI
ncbi:MAG: hypothetical protein ACFHXK_11300 [bacterium]